MLKVECESCKAPYQVDERRVPPTGLKMRCPKCGHTFLVTDPSKGAPPAGGDVAPRPPPKKATMVGVGAIGRPGGPPSPGPIAAAPPLPAPAPPVAAPPPAPPLADFGLDGLDGLELPAVKPAAPRPGAAGAAAAKPPPAAPPRVALPGLDDLDLPALAPSTALPARPGDPRRPTGTGAKPAPAPKGPPPFSFDDLPSVPGGGSGGFGSLDLPTAKGPADLPAAKGFGAIDLPAPKGGGFADLPMTQNNLPAPAGGHLPAVAKPTLGAGFGELDLPSLQNDLPQTSGLGTHLPSPAGNLPAPMGANAHMPMPVSDERLLPNRSGGGAAAMGFGELDLPLVGGGGGSAAHGGAPDMGMGGIGDLGGIGMDMPGHDPGPSPGAGGARPNAVSFGELELPADPSVQAFAPAPDPGQGGGAAGGMGFGEVDLGGGGESAPVIGPPPATSTGNFAFQEASLEQAQAPAAKRAPAAADRPSSKAPKIIGAIAAVLVIGGACLQFTPVGAFGFRAITDALHAGDYVREATQAGDEARKKLAADTFAAAQSAADEVAEARKRSPRSRSLASYAAFVEYMNQVRFGADAARGARAKTFIVDIPPNTIDVPYLFAALAAQDAANGDWAAAKRSVDTATQREPKDGIQQELAILRGEIALASHDVPGALTAFTESQTAAPSARASYGIARAHFMTKNLAKTKEAVEATLKLSPNHVGALTLRAQLTWQLQRDDAAALKDLATVLEEKTRKASGTGEVSAAFAARGWIMLARDRAGEARSSFEEAVKIDPRNASALVGLGEVLYADGRFTEALTRFDEAVTKDSHNLQATIGAAKTKIALERLADAKSQLAAARQVAPKDMSVALWLAKTEEALGNKKVAETLYGTAADLADPANPDAIEAYSAFAHFLAAQGRTSESLAKLDQAKQKLPDSPALQRAFGDVSATQGQFDEAVSHYQAALEKNPNDLGTRFRLGVTYRKMRKLDLAKQEFDNVVAIDKEYPGIALERGMLFEESGDIKGALEQFNSAYQKAPKDVDLALRVGAAYVAVGDVEKALDLLIKVKDQRPNSAEAQHYLGRAYLKMGGLESAQAMRYLKRAVDLDPNRPEYHLYVAWAANEANPVQLGIARAEVEKALALDKLLADAYWQRGIVERREGQVNDALKDLRRALELKPNRVEAHATLAECLEDKNDPAGALAEWAKAIAGNDKEPTWRWRYGRLLNDKNQHAEAAKHLAFAVNAGKSAQPRPGWLGPAAFEAGESLKKIGQKKDACEHYALYMELASPSAPDRRDAVKAMSDLGCPHEGH